MPPIDVIAEYPHPDEAAHSKAAFERLDQVLEEIYVRSFEELSDDAFYRRTADALAGQEEVLRGGLQDPDTADRVLFRLGMAKPPRRFDIEPSREEKYAIDTVLGMFNSLAPDIGKLLDTPSLETHRLHTEVMALAPTFLEHGKAPNIVELIIDRLEYDAYARAGMEQQGGDGFEGYSQLINTALWRADYDQQSRLMRKLDMMAVETCPLSFGAQIAEAGKGHVLRGLPEMRRENIVKKLMGRFDIPFATLERAWAKAASPEDLMTYRQENVALMCELENERPGICRTLFKRCNIRNFARCTKQMWITQYDELDDTDRDYGVMLTARDDHNGASWKTASVYEDLYLNLKDMDCSLRVYEVGSTEAIGTRIIRTNRQYGPAKFGILDAHGSTARITINKPFSTQTNPSESSAYIHKDTLLKPGLVAVQQAWNEAAPWTFLSCTGQENKDDIMPPIQRLISERFPKIPMIGGPEGKLLVPKRLVPIRRADGSIQIDAEFSTYVPSSKFPEEDDLVNDMVRSSSNHYRAGRIVLAASEVPPFRQTITDEWDYLG